MGTGQTGSLHHRASRTARSALLIVVVVGTSLFTSGGTASAATTPLGLGTATSFAIRAGSAVTNVPVSAITGDTGISPGTGAGYTDALFCGQVTGTIYSVDGLGPILCPNSNLGLMTNVENDARTAFNHGSALPGATPVGPDLAGVTLVAGLYSFGHGPTSNLTGTLTLDAQADPLSTWIFQASSDLVTSSASTVVFTNLPPGVTAASMACNVYWTVGSSATLATGSSFVGTILASASIGMFTGATLIGRALAANAAGGGGAVTLQQNTITRPTGCGVIPPGTGGGTGGTPTGGTPNGGTPTGGTPTGGTPTGGTPTGGTPTTQTASPPVATAPPAVTSPPTLTG
jgi:hypothetical protein